MKSRNSFNSTNWLSFLSIAFRSKTSLGRGVIYWRAEAKPSKMIKRKSCLRLIIIYFKMIRSGAPEEFKYFLEGA